MWFTQNVDNSSSLVKRPFQWLQAFGCLHILGLNADQQNKPSRRFQPTFQLRNVCVKRGDISGSASFKDSSQLYVKRNIVTSFCG